MDWGTFLFNEVKPLSLSGISKGFAQLSAYTIAYSPLGFTANVKWTPKPAIVQDEPVAFFNVSGIIFYTDDDAVRLEAAAAGALSASLLRQIVRKSASRVATRLGADAVARAAVNRGLASITAANSGRLVFQSQLLILTRF
jgi:hypothetical protein